MNTASCLACRGTFDVTYDPDTRAGRCPSCRALARALRRNARMSELLAKGYSFRDALLNAGYGGLL